MACDAGETVLRTQSGQTIPVSFVGSTPIAKYIYETAAAHGKSDAPVVKSVSPDHGSVNGGTFVDIHGSNLDSFSAVYFNGVPVTASLRSNNVIEATSPVGTGTSQITVQTPDLADLLMDHAPASSPTSPVR